MDSHGPNYEQPPPDLIKDEEEYEVDQILNSRKHGRESTLQYLVQWKGYVTRRPARGLNRLDSDNS